VESHPLDATPVWSRGSSRLSAGSRGHTAPIADQVTLAAPLGPVGRIRTRLDPPKTARTEQLSTTALDQSICPPRESQFSSAK
jgi:hypothetical protein